MSFRGLKTAMRLTIDSCRTADGSLTDRARADLAASFQAAVVETLTGKCRQALEATGLARLVIAGGVGANRALRASLAELGRSVGASVYYPKPALCTDNGAMIAYAGWCRRAAGASKLPRFMAKPRWPLEELVPPAE
jgi:N6-L-threonylcarbamoyladenine synthase